MYMYLMNYCNFLQSADLGTQGQTVPSNVLIAVMEKNANWFATVQRIFVISHQGVHRGLLVINLIFYIILSPFKYRGYSSSSVFFVGFQMMSAQCPLTFISCSPESKAGLSFSDYLFFVYVGFFVPLENFQLYGDGSHQLWDAKEPSLLNGLDCRAQVKICSTSPVMVTSPYE